MNTKPFFWKAKQILKLSKHFVPLLEFPINMFRSLSKALIKSFDPMNIGSMLVNFKFCQQI